MTPRRDLPYAELQKALQKKATDIDAESVEAALSMLDSMMARSLAAKQQLDTKLALVIPAVGTIGALIAARIALSDQTRNACTGGDAVSCAAPALLVAAAIAAATAVLLALIGLYPYSYRNGPEPTDVAFYTDAPVAVYRQSLVGAMASAVISVEDLTLRKSRFWQWSALSGVLAVLAVLGLGLMGGLK